MDTQPASSTVPQNVPPDEARAVSEWFRTLSAARQFDAPAREQYVRDRRMARGDTAALVSANLVATYIEILAAFLYARDPDLDILPSKATEPPDLAALKDTAEQMVAQMTAQLPPMPPQVDPVTGMAVDPAAMLAQAAEQQALQKFEELRTRYRKRQRENRAFAETMELVVAQLWKMAKLKKRALKQVRSALTVGPGWIKAVWVERTAYDPQTQTAINDAATALRTVEKQRRDIADDTAGGDALDAKIAEHRQTLATLQARPQQTSQRGYVIDFVPAEYVQVALGVDLEDYVESPWIAHYQPARVADAQADFGWSKEDISGATLYYARKPTMSLDCSSYGPDAKEVSAEEAMTFATGADGAAKPDAFVMVVEVWSRETGEFFKLVEGVNRYAQRPTKPCTTSRFYPLFLIPFSPLDGQRHPQSLTQRSAKLVDEYNRIGTAEAKHRQRVAPKSIVDGGNMKPEDVGKIESGGTAEIIVVKPIVPGQPVGNLVQTIAYPPLDPLLYDRSRIIAELERIWGIQEALSGSVDVAKTATEADIQQQGFQARSSSRRDVIEECLSELARYTAEIAWQKMSTEDVTRICGPDAFWQPPGTPDDLSAILNIDIRAGTSGKPNQRKEREAWAETLPLIQGLIQQIGLLRMSPQPEIADCLEKLLRETVARSGDRLDVDILIPQTVTPAAMLPPIDPNNPAQPGAAGATA